MRPIQVGPHRHPHTLTPSHPPALTGNTNYEDVSPYDIADMLKLYFRELPEPLLTNKLSEILIAIHGSKSLVISTQ